MDPVGRRLRIVEYQHELVHVRPARGFDGALDDDVLGDAEVELHLVIDGRELAPIFAEEGGRGALALRRLGGIDEDADLAEGQCGGAEVAGNAIIAQVAEVVDDELREAMRGGKDWIARLQQDIARKKPTFALNRLSR